jgi:phosphoglycolate phosphatase
MIASEADTMIWTPRYRLVIFDFDGTLADTKVGIAETVNRTLTTFGHPSVPNARIHELAGLSLERIFNSLIPTPLAPSALAELVGYYRSHYNAIAPKSVRLFPGIHELLEALRRLGVVLTIATSKGREGIMLMLEALEVAEFFDLVVSDTCVARKKPEPDMVLQTLEKIVVGPLETIVVGDTTHDIRMGKAAGTHTCGVTFGSHTEAQLAAESPTYIARDPGELLQVLLPARS